MSKDIEDLKSGFETATSVIKNSGISPSNQDLAELYGYYKQATIGDCNISAPSFWDFKGKAKFEAWNQLKGMEKERAMRRYIRKVTELTS